jgi:hypothetical protein
VRKEIKRPACIEEPGKKWREVERRAVRHYVEAVEDYVYGLEQSLLAFVFQRETGLDPTKPPHDVPCPRCLAFALEPCRSEPRTWPPGEPHPGRWPDSSLLMMPHAERLQHRERHPEYRVVGGMP